MFLELADQAFKIAFLGGTPAGMVPPACFRPKEVPMFQLPYLLLLLLAASADAQTDAAPIIDYDG